MRLIRLDEVNNFIMSKCTHTSTDPSMLLVKSHTRYAALKKTIKMYLAPTDDSIELERQLNRFIHEVVKIILYLILQIKSYTHIWVQIYSNEWNYVYYLEILKDDSGVRSNFSMMVTEVRVLYLWDCSTAGVQNVSRVLFRLSICINFALSLYL